MTQVDGKSNIWKFEVVIGETEDGKTIRKYKRFEGTKEEAEKALKEFEAECLK